MKHWSWLGSKSIATHSTMAIPIISPPSLTTLHILYWFILGCQPINHRAVATRPTVATRRSSPTYSSTAHISLGTAHINMNAQISAMIPIGSSTPNTFSLLLDHT